ncbi:hypothetical protein [Streptomyces sp. NRRL S-646]|uniref:hypothetical protein n=1 Tax=Streptomyces sp. NRRL S-646 TaxID=1463917 RepID=UPI0004C8C057|nr:hypothetical protein [Streptomyces sp. NRRL S-646]
MTRLAQRYWASLTDSSPDAWDRLIVQGRRRDLPLWRRYVASLLDVEAVGRERAGAEGSEQEVAERDSPQSTVYYTLDSGDEGGAGVPRRDRSRGMVSWALAAVFVGVTVFGVSFHRASQEQVTTPVEIGGAPRRTPPPGAHREPGGFAWVTPKGWHRDVKTGAEVHYTSPSGDQEIVAKSSRARGDLMKTWRDSEKNARQGQGYQKIQLEEARFEGWPAVLWEYTFTLSGVRWRAVLLGFDANGKSYQINTWYHPKIEPRALDTYAAVRDSFTVL